MIFIYRFLINLVFLLSPIIFIYRFIKKKEDKTRFIEKFSLNTKKRLEGDLIWFHGASVGELQSITPIIEAISKSKNIKQILLTSNTLSSAKIVNKLKIKKIVHQYFPLDCNFIDKKFLNYWKPSKAIFIDSEIWPNMINNLHRKNIKIILVNARITKKSFLRWFYFSSFAKSIFRKIDLCLSSDKESYYYLKKLGAKNVKFYGNLKFAQSEKNNLYLSSKLNNFFKKKKIWCAASTHHGEEKFCALVHKELKKKYKNLVTIIVPRHIERTNHIFNELIKFNFKVHIHNPSKKIIPLTDIYLVNTYGESKKFYNVSDIVFLGGSLVNHGGQNPLEAVRLGCNIIYGPNVNNFREVYHFLTSKSVATKIYNTKDTIKKIEKLFSENRNINSLKKNIKKMGSKILNNYLREISQII